MSFYIPAFQDKAEAQFRQLSPWQQEAVLDAIEQMLESSLPPSIASRWSEPMVEHHDVMLSHEGKQHYIFLTAELHPDVPELRIIQIGVLVKPA